MQVPAKFHVIPSMGLQDIKETKHYRRTDGRTHGQRENSIPHLKLRFGGRYTLFALAEEEVFSLPNLQKEMCRVWGLSLVYE